MQVIKTNKGYKLVVEHPHDGYNWNIDTLVKAKDTGNGLIITFKSNSICKQDYIICLDYSQADELRILLDHIFQRPGFKEEA